MSDDVVGGLVVDAAAKVATLVPQRRATVEAALAFLAATGDTEVADHLEALAEGPRLALLDDIAARVARLVAGWPAIDPAWWPRVEEPVRVRLAGGAVTVGGRWTWCSAGRRPHGRRWRSRSRAGAGTTGCGRTPTSTPCWSPCGTAGHRRRP